MRAGRFGSNTGKLLAAGLLSVVFVGFLCGQWLAAERHRHAGVVSLKAPAPLAMLPPAQAPASSPEPSKSLASPLVAPPETTAGRQPQTEPTPAPAFPPPVAPSPPAAAPDSPVRTAEPAPPASKPPVVENPAAEHTATVGQPARTIEGAVLEPKSMPAPAPTPTLGAAAEPAPAPRQARTPEPLPAGAKPGPAPAGADLPVRRPRTAAVERPGADAPIAQPKTKPASGPERPVVRQKPDGPDEAPRKARLTRLAPPSKATDRAAEGRRPPVVQEERSRHAARGPAVHERRSSQGIGAGPVRLGHKFHRPAVRREAARRLSPGTPVRSYARGQSSPLADGRGWVEVRRAFP